MRLIMPAEIPLYMAVLELFSPPIPCETKHVKQNEHRASQVSNLSLMLGEVMELFSTAPSPRKPMCNFRTISGNNSEVVVIASEPHARNLSSIYD